MNAILALFPPDTGIKGESLIYKKLDFIELLTFDHGLAMQITKDISNTKRTSGKPDVQDVTITKYLDKSSPIINQLCCEGSPIGPVLITFGQVEEGHYIGYMAYILNGVIISSVSVQSRTDDKPVETITLNFSKIMWAWVVQDNAGYSCGFTSGCWNIAENQANFLSSDLIKLIF